jgi:hypothetical protein
MRSLPLTTLAMARSKWPLLSTDHELIPARNASLAAKQVSAREVIFVTIQRENIRPSKKELNKSVTVMLKLLDICS